MMTSACADASRSILVSHPTLNANSKNAFVGLERAGLLREAHTSLFVPEAWQKYPMLRKVARRTLPPEVASKTRMHPTYEVLRVLRTRGGLPSWLVGERNVHGLYAQLDRLVSLSVDSRLRGVMAYEDGALLTFEAAARQGVGRIYDLPIPFWRTKHALLLDERVNNPAWSALLGGLDDAPVVLRRKDSELELADVVLSASSTTTDSVIREFPDKRVVQALYGAPAVHSDDESDFVQAHRGGPLRLLYVGSLTQRKGLSYMFDAVAELASSVELTVVGMRTSHKHQLLEQELAKHRHFNSLPHDAILRLMRSSDVLVFPSLIEGSGLVITEALSQGLPVIATNNTIARDIFTAEASAWMVPIQSSSAIVSALEAFVANERYRFASRMTAKAIARGLNWDAYQADVVSAVSTI